MVAGSSLIDQLHATVEMSSQSWSTPSVYQLDGECYLVCCDRKGQVRALSGADLSETWLFDSGNCITASPVIIPMGEGAAVIVGDESGMLHALDLSDGQPLWQRQYGSCIRSTVAYDQDEHALYVGVYGAWMIRLDADDGGLVWKRYLPKHEYFNGSKQGVVSSPLLADVNLDGKKEIVIGMRSKRIYCLSASTGQILWFREFSYDPDSSPSFAVIEDRPLVFFGGGEHTGGQGDNAVFALNGNDGSIAWRESMHGGLDSCPVIADIDQDGQDELVITSLADASCYALRAADGSQLWQYRFGPTAICRHDDYNICRLEDSGRYFTEDAICRSYTTPLIMGGGDKPVSVVVGSNNGQLVVLDGANGTVQAQDQTGGMVRGSPVLADIDADGSNELIITSGAALRIYRTVDSGAGWPMFKGSYEHIGARREAMSDIVRDDLPSQRFMMLKLYWVWWVKDLFRFLLFKFEHKVLRRLGLKICDYYY